MSRYSQQGGKRTSRLFMQDEWVPNRYYHIIGKAIPGEVLFREEIDYRRFLRKGVRNKYKLIFQIYVYCLLENHFHLVVRTRSNEEICEELASVKRLASYQVGFLEGRLSWKAFVKKTFRAPANSHAQYFNKRYGREGQLFVRPTLHGLCDKGDVPGMLYSRKLAAYVALNFYKHGYAGPEDLYPWSSLTAPKYYIIEPDFELHYGSEEAYKTYHKTYLKRYGAKLLNFDEKAFFAALTPRVYYEDYDEWRIEVATRKELGNKD